MPILETKKYENLDDSKKGLFIKELLKEIRGPAKETAKETKPELFGIIELQKVPKREKLVIQKPLEEMIKKLKNK